MHKLCIWMNIPSHYQSAFFAALAARDDIDLKVVYLNETSGARAAEGWSDSHEYQPYESSAAGRSAVACLDDLVLDWASRTHLICGYFASDLIDLFSRKGARWCHWSEMPGIRLAELLGYRMVLFRWLNPFMLSLKRAEGRRIKNHALGAFGQGLLARRAFARMGVPENKMADLYYVPAPLQHLDPSEKVHQFANGRKVILAVGALCRRKGIDVLLKAFARLRNNDWCLVLCGLDRSDGLYEKCCHKLGLDDRVLFLGAYPSERIAEVYAASDVFVLASRFDGWGAVLNEAASLGLPLIGTDLCGGSWHLIDPGTNGFRLRAGSVYALAGALSNYTDHPERIRTHGEASRKLFYDAFTPELNADRLVTALEAWENR